MSSSDVNSRGLALVGVRGTGKSTVGRLLAERLDRPFLDADAVLEARLGTSIPTLFAEQGEPVFRDWEERVLADLTGQSGAVIATGGGVVLRATNRRRLREFGLVVWLAADPETLAQRLRSDPRGLAGRPALTSSGTLDEIANVLEARTPLYQEVADAVVQTQGRTAREVAEAVFEVWADQNARARRSELGPGSGPDALGLS
jgi:shikimate kinase